MDTDNGVWLPEGKGDGGRTKRVKGVKYMVTEREQASGGEPQCNIQMMHYNIVHLKLI